MTAIRYVINAKVVRLEERHKTLYVSGSGDGIVTRQQSLGWFVQFEGSYEMLFIGHDEPVGLSKGDAVHISIEKIDVKADPATAS